MSEEMNDDAWFEQGYDSVQAPTENTGNKVIRFWMPKNTEKLLVFLTGEPTTYWEHSCYLDGNWRNFFTCVRPMGKECPLCAAQKTKARSNIQLYQACVFTVIDTSKFTDRQGKERENVKKLYVAKSAVAEKLKKRHLKAKASDPLGLRGLAVTVSRGKDAKSPGVGEDFDVESRIDLSTLADSVEFDYRTILKPDIDAMKRIAQRLGAIASSEGKKDSGEVDYN